MDITVVDKNMQFASTQKKKDIVYQTSLICKIVYCTQKTQLKVLVKTVNNKENNNLYLYLLIPNIPTS